MALRLCGLQGRREGQSAAVFERHHLKGAKEQGFSEVLSGLDLHHPPCTDLMANQAFYAIAMLAYNVLISLRGAGPARRGAELAHSTRSFATC